LNCVILDDDYGDYDMVDYSQLNTKKLDELNVEAKKKALEMMDKKAKKKEKKRRKLQRKKKMKEKITKMKVDMISYVCFITL